MRWPLVFALAGVLLFSAVFAGSFVPSARAGVPAPPVNLIQNGGFEHGALDWSLRSQGQYRLVSDLAPHDGQYSLWLCGVVACDDRASQEVSLPANPGQAIFAFWLRIVHRQPAGDRTCSPSFHAWITGTSGRTVATMPAMACAAGATDAWTYQSADVTTQLAAYAGRVVRIHFAATGTSGLNSDTIFLVDDVSLDVAGAPTATATATDTPTPMETDTSTPVPTTGPDCPGSNLGCMQAMLDLINASRAKYSSQSYPIGPLSINYIQSAGQGQCVGSIGHSDAMAQSGQIWHTNSSYPAASFPNNICIQTYFEGENVGMSNSGNELTDLQTLHSEMMSESWQPGCEGDHACNILNSKFTSVGIGIYVDGSDRTWLTEDFIQ